MSAPHYSFNVRDDVDCLVTSVVAENPALRLMGETGGFDEVMQTLLTAGCIYMRSREGVQIDDEASVFDVARAARLLGHQLAVRGGDLVVVPIGTPGVVPVRIVERDAAYDQTDRTAAATDCASDSLARGVA